MVILCALCCFINYADRVNLSVAIIAIGEEYQFSVKQQGVIMSSFFLGYLPMQLGGAILCRRFGGKRVLSWGAFLWSMFTFLTPLASATGYYPLLLCRVLMGLSEGVAFPSIFHFLSAWVPANERSRSISCFLTGVHVGTTFALIVSPIIIRVSSWQNIFYSFGVAGLVWILAWNLLAYDREGQVKEGQGSIEKADLLSVPQSTNIDVVDGLSSEKNPVSAETERDDVISGYSPSIRGGLTSNDEKSRLHYQLFGSSETSVLRHVLTNRSCIAVCVTQGLHGLIHYTILSWLPSYFKNVFDTETSSLSFTSLPYLSMAVAANMGGYAADRLHERGMSLTKARKIMTFIANTGAGALLVGFSLARTVPSALFMISMSMGFMSLNSGGFESSFLDMSSPGVAGTFKAVANTMGSFAGFVAIPFSTLVLQWANESWRFMFGSLCVWYAVATTIFCRYSSSEKILHEDSR